MYKVVPFLRVRYGDVAQNGPADDVVAVATGLFFERCWVDPRIDADSRITKKTGASSGGLFLLADRSVCVAMCTLQC